MQFAATTLGSVSSPVGVWGFLLVLPDDMNTQLEQGTPNHTLASNVAYWDYQLFNAFGVLAA